MARRILASTMSLSGASSSRRPCASMSPSSGEAGMWLSNAASLKRSATHCAVSQAITSWTWGISCRHSRALRVDAKDALPGYSRYDTVIPASSGAPFQKKVVLPKFCGYGDVVSWHCSQSAVGSHGWLEPFSCAEECLHGRPAIEGELVDLIEHHKAAQRPRPQRLDEADEVPEHELRDGPFEQVLQPL